MLTITDIRTKYPQYKDKSDEELADALHGKYYSQVPKEDFYSKIGLNVQPTEEISTEKTGLSGIASDVMDKAVQGVLGLPEAVMGLPGEIKGAYNQLTNEPKRAAQNIGGGFGELGHGILSVPANLRDYLVQKAILSKQSPSMRLPESILPKEYNYAENLGRQGQKPGDVLLGQLPELAASGGVGKILNPILSEIPLTKGLAARHLKSAQKLVKESGISGLPLSEHLLEEAKQFLPNNLPTQNLLKQAASGDYNSIFTMQSDLAKAARELTKSSSGAERLHGLAANDLRQRMLHEFRQNLTKSGLEKAAKLMQRGQNKYRQHHQIKKYVYGPIKTLGAPASVIAALGMGGKWLLNDNNNKY